MRRWWLGLALIWLLGTAADRLWLAADQRLPSWDPAEYLTSALEHGQALGLLPGGGWHGWGALLELSPKIPPLASLVNGTVMAIAGDAPDQASWALALWQALLLLAVAGWGRQLAGPAFGLLAAALTTTTPALASLRTTYSLDLPLAATTTLALWQLGRWQAPAPKGGRWGQALAAALAIAAAALVKQSALPVLLLPCLWATGLALGQRQRRWQVLLALSLALALWTPWLQHNLITAVGGTERAVVESARLEGDPAVFSAAGLLWYPRLLASQLGWPLLFGASGGGALAMGRRMRQSRWSAAIQPWALAPGWAWLLGCSTAALLGISLSPNKDPRYLAPLLPLLILLLSAGWWHLGQSLARSRWGGWGAALALSAGLLSAGVDSAQGQISRLQRQPGSPAEQVMAELRRRNGNAPITLTVIPSTPELNEQTLSFFGQRRGGQVLARRLGTRRREQPLVLAQAEWLLLATGDQGSRRRASRELSRRVRTDGRFELVASWPWSKGRRVELWQRRAGQPAGRFDPHFERMALGLAQGPAGLTPLFDAIGPQHQLDGHVLYQQRLFRKARLRLQRDPNDPQALWTLALLHTLNRQSPEASSTFARLETLYPSNPWPSAYRCVVLLSSFDGAAAAKACGQAPRADHPVVATLADLGRLLSGRLDRIPALQRSLPLAIQQVKDAIEPKPGS